MCCPNSKKQRETIDKIFQYNGDYFILFKAFNMLKSPEIQELLEKDLMPKIQEMMHKLEEEL